MGLKKFTDFDSRTPLLTGDFLVGYKNDASKEFRTQISDLIEALKPYFIRNHTLYKVAGCERMQYGFLRYFGNDVLVNGTIVNNENFECFSVDSKLIDYTNLEDFGEIVTVFSVIGDCEPCFEYILRPELPFTQVGIFQTDINSGQIVRVTIVSDSGYYKAIWWDGTIDIMQSANMVTKTSIGGLRNLSAVSCDVFGKPSGNIITIVADMDPNVFVHSNVSGLTALQGLQIENNKLIDLDISNCISLTYVHSYNNNLTSINLQNTPLLTAINITNNNLDENSLNDIFNNLNNDNVIKEISIENNPGEPTCDRNIAINNNWIVYPEKSSKIINLSTIQTAGDPIQLQFNSDSGFYKVNWWDAPEIFNSGDVTDKPALGSNETFNVFACDSTGNIFGNLFGNVNCSNSGLVYADFSRISEIEMINLDYNNLNTLKVSNCNSLKDITCTNNELTSIDVSNCSSLSSIYLFTNQLDVNNLETIFNDLSSRIGISPGYIDITNNVGESLCDKMIAYNKNWTVEPPLAGLGLVTFQINGSLTEVNPGPALFNVGDFYTLNVTYDTTQHDILNGAGIGIATYDNVSYTFTCNGYVAQINNVGQITSFSSPQTTYGYDLFTNLTSPNGSINAPQYIGQELAPNYQPMLSLTDVSQTLVSGKSLPDPFDPLVGWTTGEVKFGWETAWDITSGLPPLFNIKGNITNIINI